jgi:hypothetical protein
MSSSTTAASLLPSSLEDQEVRRLCESGDLTQVAGSQSLLSQELLEQSQQSQSQSQSQPAEDLNFSQDSNDNDGNDDDKCDDKTLSAYAVTAAQRYGILTQDDDDDDDDNDNDSHENQENTPANSQSQPSSSSTRKHTQTNHDANVVSTNKVSASTTSVLLPLPLSFPMSLSPPKDHGNDATSVPYDDTMDLVMELDEAFTGLDAIKLAATGNRGKKRSTMNTAGQTTPNVFGSLLDAVQVVQRQSMSPRNNSRLQKQQQQREHSMDPHMTTTGNMLFPPAHAHPTRALTPAEVANASAANKKQKSQPPPGKQKEAPVRSNKKTMKHPILNSLSQAPHYPPATSQRQAVAQRAAALAVRVSSDADLAKRLLLSMAMLRDNPRQVPLPSPPAGQFLEDGFFWSHYPILEQILKDNMARYYALSIGKCQSPEQHTFNNTLVVLVRQTVTAREWSFDRIFMCDKVLRDRIRCYYKTHIQNAKKRLRTMLKNPTKKANAGHLIQHWELIRETIVSKHSQMPMNSNRTTASSSPSSISSDSNNDSGSNKEDEKKVTKKVAARRVTMEEIRFDEQK